MLGFQQHLTPHPVLRGTLRHADGSSQCQGWLVGALSPQSWGVSCGPSFRSPGLPISFPKRAHFRSYFPLRKVQESGCLFPELPSFPCIASLP